MAIAVGSAYSRVVAATVDEENRDSSSRSRGHLSRDTWNHSISVGILAVVNTSPSSEHPLLLVVPELGTSTQSYIVTMKPRLRLSSIQHKVLLLLML